MRRLAVGALTGGWMLAAACTTGGPYQDTVDADVDAAWKLPHADAAQPTLDAIVLGDPDAPNNRNTPLEAGESSATSDAGAPDATQPSPEASTDAQPDAGDAKAPGSCTLTSCGTRAVCAGGSCVLARRVFVSAATFPADFGGFSGADVTCQHLALAAGLGGVWMAWVSDVASSPSQRFNRASYEYALLDGTVVAPSYTGLVSGTLAHAIDLDEHGAAVTSSTTEVWTATNPDGTLQADGCESFTVTWKGAPNVEVGVAGNADATWTAVYQQFCNRSDHLYCVEQ